MLKRNREFERLTKLTQSQMKLYVANRLRETYPSVIIKDGYVFAKGNYPVLLVAHMDTVHEHTPKKFVYEAKGNKISSPQGLGGDDRCGIYMIFQIIKDIKCSVLFVEDEEIGSVGSNKFVKSFKDELDINYIIELDRRGSNDAVYYELDNYEFESFITESSGGHFKTAFGSFTDICILAPFFEVAAVNLSCGYYHEHHDDTYVLYSEMEKNIEKTKQIIKTKVDKPFEYKEMSRTNLEGFKYSGYDWDWRWDYCEEYFVRFVDFDGKSAVNIVEAVSDEEAIGKTVWDIQTISGENIIEVGLTIETELTENERVYYNGKEEKYAGYGL